MESPGTPSKTPETLVQPIGILAAKGHRLNVFNERPVSHQSLSLGYLQKLYYIFWFLDVWTVHMFLKVLLSGSEHPQGQTPELFDLVDQFDLCLTSQAA